MLKYPSSGTFDMLEVLLNSNSEHCKKYCKRSGAEQRRKASESITGFTLVFF